VAYWLGLTPREFSSGPNRLLGRISKRGDVYVRMLLVHGARSALSIALMLQHKSPEKLTRIQRWAVELKDRVGMHKAIPWPTNSPGFAGRSGSMAIPLSPTMLAARPPPSQQPQPRKREETIHRFTDLPQHLPHPQPHPPRQPASRNTGRTGHSAIPVTRASLK
jgi:hypothetical protein